MSTKNNAHGDNMHGGIDSLSFLHRFFDLYSDSAFFRLRELFAENRSALAAQNDFVFWGEATVGFQYLLVVYRHRARGYRLRRRRTREREYLACHCVESRRCYGDARFLYIYLRRATSPSGICLALSVARPAPVRLSSIYFAAFGRATMSQPSG